LSSNPRDYEGKNYTFFDKMAKIGILYQISQQYGIDRNHIFSAGRQMYADYTRSSAIAEGLREALVGRNPATTKHLT